MSGTSLGTTLSSGAETNVSQIILTKGTWILLFQGDIQHSGDAFSFMSTIRAGSNNIAMSMQGLSKYGITRTNIMAIVKPSSTTTYYGRMFQNSGSNVNIVSNSLVAVKLSV